MEEDKKVPFINVLAGILSGAFGFVLGGTIGLFIQKGLFDVLHWNTIPWEMDMLAGAIYGFPAGFVAVLMQRPALPFRRALLWAVVAAVSVSAGWGAVVALQDEILLVVNWTVLEEWHCRLMIGAAVGIIQWGFLTVRYKYSLLWIPLTAVLLVAGLFAGEEIADSFSRGGIMHVSWQDAASAAAARVIPVAVLWGLLTSLAYAYWPRAAQSK